MTQLERRDKAREDETVQGRDITGGKRRRRKKMNDLDY